MEENDIDEIYEDLVLPNNEFGGFYFINDNNNTNIINGFKEINQQKISTKLNSLYNEVQEETSKIYLYFSEKMKFFPKIFEKNFTSLEEVYQYLESISIENKCQCAGIIDNIPGWRCNDCSKYENCIYCSNCYINSKHLHKDHKVYFLYSSAGMCDCGDPDSLYSFCPQHCGPYTNQSQIDDFIGKIFPPNILNNLKVFFGDLFLEFTKYLLLTEKCEYFCSEIMEENLKNEKEKNDVILLKNNFSTVFQNLLHFLYKISEKNLGMVHLLASFLLKNNIPTKNDDDHFTTTHSCIKIDNDNIEILYKINNNDNKDKSNIFSFFNFTTEKKHKCECPFLRLLFSNWRDSIKPFSKDKSQNEKFLISFSHNLFLRTSSAIIILFLYKEIIINNFNEDIIFTKNQYSLEDTYELIAKKTNLIEETYEFLYFYIEKILLSSNSRDEFGGYKPTFIGKTLDKIRIFMNDAKYFTKPKIRKLMGSKTNILKRLIDIFCLFHKQMEFKSYMVHPSFREKKAVIELIDLELFFIYISNVTFLYTAWDNIEIVKELFNYFIEKILYLQMTKVLKKDEFSFHISLYRIFGAFINYFCFYYAINNKTSINESINFIKMNLFKSKSEMQNIINLILEDYYKMYGFIIGIRNEYFNYYDVINYNFIYFNDLRMLKQDLNLLKYLFAMTEESINIKNILEISNIENVYDIFNKTFILNNNKEENTDKIEGNKQSKISYFSKIFNTIKSYFSFNVSKGDKENENKIVMQWSRILELLILIMKNDTTPLSTILTYFNEAISLQTKNTLFNCIKENKYLMEDCRNMLKERLVQIIIANGNLIDLEGIKKVIDNFYFLLFEKQEFNNILNELTICKMNGEKKQYYIKDSCFKYLDMNYYYSPMTKSKAELYISNFKKDSFKMNNTYFYNPSIVLFDFYHKVYQNILLNVENINLFIDIIKVLLNASNEEEYKLKNDIIYITKGFLPIILNFLNILGTINSKTFIKFKIENEDLINKICNILNDAIKNNKSKETKIINNELEENILYTITQLNKYKTLKEYLNNDFNKMSDKNYYTEEEFNKLILKENNNLNKINLNQTNTKEDSKKTKANIMKAHLKNLMKNQSDKFLKKASKNKDIEQIINQSKIIKEENNEKENDIMMCFFCRNEINLKSFDKPYGKLGLIFDDYFYFNSFKSTLKTELNNNIDNTIENKEKIIDNIYNNIKYLNQKKSRITSCGHYFHQSCFNKGFSFENGFKCPLCEKNHNFIIPPLINFYKTNLCLKSFKFQDLINKNINNINIDGKNNFENIAIKFLSEITKISNINSINYNFLLSNFQSYCNFLINLFYSNGMTFHKLQQIEIIQNMLLSIRYLTNINYFKITQIIDKIHSIINILINGDDYCNIENFENMNFNNNFDNLLFSFSILLDYDEFKNSFTYIINWILPYICVWSYLRYLIIKNDFLSLFKENIIEKINISDLKQFLIENNEQMNNYLKLYLHKLFILKIITSYDNKNKEINYNIKELTIDKLFSLLDMDTLFQSLPKNSKNEIIFYDTFEKVKLFDKPNKYIIINNYYEKLERMIYNFKKNNIKNELVKAELFVQFIPYQFKLISLDNNIFDWFEKCLYKKCSICLNISKYYCICLICGEKICHTKSCNKITQHVSKCGGQSGIFIDINDAKLILIKNSSNFRNKTYPLYINNSGVGPSDYEIGNEFNLSQEKYNLALKDYISNDFK